MSSRHNVSGAMIHSRARFCGAPVALNDIKVFKDFKDLRVVRSGRRLSGGLLGCRVKRWAVGVGSGYFTSRSGCSLRKLSQVCVPRLRARLSPPRPLTRAVPSARSIGEDEVK